MNSLISIVNTSANTNALKIKFLESKNNRDVLAFNLYLGPYDIWTSALVKTQSTLSGHNGEDSVKLITNDISCAVPSINGQEFLPYAMEGEFDDGYANNLSRATEGQIHIIDMGSVTGEMASWADPSNGGEFNCNAIELNWLPPDGIWQSNANENLSAPSLGGDIYGWLSLIDVQNGIDVSYNAQALQGYTNETQHMDPASLTPDLASGNQTQSLVNSQGVTGFIDWSSPVDAVSSIFMATELFEDYVLSDSISANSEWVFSFPTKHFYTDPMITESQQALAPFTSVNGECETAVLKMYNRDSSNSSSNIDFCYGVNVLALTEMNEASTPILGSLDSAVIESEFSSGWAQMVFSQSLDMQGGMLNGDSNLVGLPVTGFAIQRYVNNNLDGGILANYAGLLPLISKMKTH